MSNFNINEFIDDFPQDSLSELLKEIIFYCDDGSIEEYIKNNYYGEI